MIGASRGWRAVAGIAALALATSAIPAPATADWNPIPWTFCGSLTTTTNYSVDDLLYVTEPVLSAYRVVGDQTGTYEPIRLGVDYTAAGEHLSTAFGFATLNIQFPRVGRYLTVMQFTPFIVDVETADVRATGKYPRPGTPFSMVFAPPFPLITNVTFRVVLPNGRTPVADGTEALFAGKSVDIDPYAAVTRSGDVLTHNLAGTASTSALCVTNLHRRRLPNDFPPLANSVYVEIPNVNGQGTFCDWVTLPESNTTITIKLKSTACAPSTVHNAL